MSSCAAESKWDCWRFVSVLTACSSMTQHWNTLCNVYPPALYISLLYILTSECTKKMPTARNKFHGKAVVREPKWPWAEHANNTENSPWPPGDWNQGPFRNSNQCTAVVPHPLVPHVVSLTHYYNVLQALASSFRSEMLKPWGLQSKRVFFRPTR